MKKLLFTIGFLLFLICYCYSQYDYGLDVCEKDARIDGKLNLGYGKRNIYIGLNAGLNINKDLTHTSGSLVNFDNIAIGNQASMGTSQSGFHGSVFIGSEVGRLMEDGSEDVFIGYRSAFNKTHGGGNVFLGVGTGENNLVGETNTFIGGLSGSNNSGSGNVFLGFSAGFDEPGSNKLYIETSFSSRTSPLIYGEFDNDKVQINGSLHVTEFARLVPSATPNSPEKGTMYYDSADDKVKVWTGSTWENLFFSASTQTEHSFTGSNESPCNTSCYEVQAENQQLKARMEQLEAEVKAFSSMKSDLEEMKQLVSQLSDSPSLHQKVEISKSARLGQNVPNPFNGTTKIRYSLPENSKDASIKIYDISGRIVKEVKIQGSGQGEIEVQVEESSTGIYHYSLEIDGQIIDTKKMSSMK